MRSMIPSRTTEPATSVFKPERTISPTPARAIGACWRKKATSALRGLRGPPAQPELQARPVPKVLKDYRDPQARPARPVQQVPRDWFGKEHGAVRQHMQ